MATPSATSTEEHEMLPRESTVSRQGQNDEENILSKDDYRDVVWWDGDNDPSNPYNWPSWVINVNCGLLTFLNFVTPLASSMVAPGIPQIMEEFGNTSLELSAFVLSIYVLGFAFGPLIFAPMSEIYGRAITYHICNVGWVAFIIGCALAPSLGSLIAFRFLSGAFGSCSITNGGGSIADMIHQEKRGAYMGLFSVGPLLGPVIGPVAGGFLSAAKGWRWIFWLLTIVGGVLTIAMFIFMRESYAPLLLERKAIARRKETGNDQLRSKLDSGLRSSEVFKRAIMRPMKLLIFSPISFVCALYMAIVYGYLYLMFSTITQVFEENYGFPTNLVGLVYLGLGLGSIIGIASVGATSDRHIKKRVKIDGEAKPEDRLQLVPIGGFFLPAGLFMYGWTVQYHVHWIVPVIGMVIVGTGNMIIFMALVLYIVDAFTLYSASALAANAFIRSIAGAVLPLAGLKMFVTLGIGWGNSLLGFIAVAMIPVPFLLSRYGELLRTRYEVKNL